MMEKQHGKSFIREVNTEFLSLKLDERINTKKVG